MTSESADAVLAGPPTSTIVRRGLSGRFRVAAIGAAAVVGLGIGLVLIAPPAKPDDLVPVLIAIGALCLSILARDRASGLAWASLVVASLAGSSVPISLSRGADRRGFTAESAADAVRSGSRGLADLARRASAVGGSLIIDARDPTGTIVRFDWPARS